MGIDVEHVLKLLSILLHSIKGKMFLKRDRKSLSKGSGSSRPNFCIKWRSLLIKSSICYSWSVVSSSMLAIIDLETIDERSIEMSLLLDLPASHCSTWHDFAMKRMTLSLATTKQNLKCRSREYGWARHTFYDFKWSTLIAFHHRGRTRKNRNFNLSKKHDVIEMMKWKLKNMKEKSTYYPESYLPEVPEFLDPLIYFPKVIFVRQVFYFYR